VRPDSTYRVQLHPGFTFDDAAEVAAYLGSLGVTHMYCSPYLQAASGSTHGYDVVDPQRLNSELGGAPSHARLVGALRQAGIGQILDIVPNHMAVDPDNRWWWDVLENGPASLFANFFDVDWEGHDDRSAFTVLAPVLGDHYGRVLEAGELTIGRIGGSFVARYFDHTFPISPRTVDDILAPAARRRGSPELAALAEAAKALPLARMADHAAVVERHDRKVEHETALSALCETRPEIAEAIDNELDALNADASRLDALLRRQNYRLAHWRVASEELDYRRFFNIETLVGVRVEDPQVFAQTHGLVIELVRDGTLDGLRVDHVDGLLDPAGYLKQLGEATGGIYTVVEKILGAGEPLPDSWPIEGTSGYDFLIRTNNLFVDPRSEAAMTEAYQTFTGVASSYQEIVHGAKQQVMRHELSAEVERLTSDLAAICDGHRRHRDHTRRELRDGLREFLAHFPVYRTYVQPRRRPSSADCATVNAAVKAAEACRPDIDGEFLDFLGQLALGQSQAAREVEFAQRLQQLSGPVMAKGVEDTAFYRYNRLVSLNEVGGDPGIFGSTVDSFHDQTAAMAQRWPRSLLTLSTHDTKRSADVRARLNVLSEMPVEWQVAVERWAQHNERYRGGWNDLNTEYLLYQTLVGAWPIAPDRAVAYMTKATKEAKVHTSWTEPVATYDNGLEHFVRAILADPHFTTDVSRFLEAHRIIERGSRNSVAQTALLLTCPGVPDLYQGSELWDLSLVDPDNRRPVDYELRRSVLAEARRAPSADAMGRAEVGGPKLWTIQKLLAYRQEHRDVFASSHYEPLAIVGQHTQRVAAFCRDSLAVVVPCHTGHLNDTAVELPQGRWWDLMTGAETRGGRQAVDRLLWRFPVAVLAGEG